MVNGAISFTRYVDITSGVGANALVKQRELIGRLFTTNNIVPPQSFHEFENADDVASYFGSSSEEYLRAAFYFGWVSKSIKAAQKISFARWVDADVGSMIFGTQAVRAVSTFTLIASGGFTLTLGGFTHTLTGINLTAATSLSDVASAIQTAIRAYSAGGTAWTGATITYDATNSRFKLVSGATGTDTVAVVAATTGTDLAYPIGWLTGAILCNGALAESLTTTLSNSVQGSNNFGSFTFLLSDTFSTTQNVEIATWNATQNIMFQYMVPVTAANASAQSAALLSYPGCAMTLTPLSTEYPEMIPMIILAATDYTSVNGTQNYMFQQFTVTPSVLNNADADTYDALRVNYYGQTQTAGQYLAFYQRGQLTGTGTAPTDQNVYANEQWMKDDCAAQIMTLLLSLPKVSANDRGRSQLMTVLQGVISLALKNGTISVGKTFSSVQKIYITNATGDAKAWFQVQNIGYWLDIEMQSFVDDSGATEYKAVYTLIYAKDDIIRKVEGTHVLI